MSGMKTILSMDMVTLGHGLFRFWSWWLAELRSGLPSFLFRSRVGKAQLVAEYVDERLVFREYRAGTALPVPRFGTPEKLLPKAAFALPAGEVLVHELELPVMPPGQMREATAMDIDRLTPFAAEEVVFDLEPSTESEPDKATVQVALAVVERENLKARILRLNEAVGRPRTVCVVDHHLGVPRFDFLKALDMAEGVAGQGRLRAAAWSAAALLLVANVAVFIARDAASVRALSDQVEAQKSSVAVVNTLRHRVETETGRRRMLLRMRTQTAPLAVLAAVTRALPDSAYVQRFEWDGARLSLSGVAQPGTDVLAPLQSSAMLHDVRYSGPAKPAGDGSFAVTIRPKMGGRL
jgi:hypothetical protein